ncbi:hypothetical protein [Leucobacter allii]|uniref:hypothetical protein n=1 Tax=Leucobacter allii TaxID=2932247 RepID=UPI0021119D54|nr:hypothetical protein [Leucobacter allii]
MSEQGFGGAEAPEEPRSSGGRTARKQVLLRLDPAVHAAVARWAADDLRSVNAQIEVLLRRALAEAGREVRAAPMRGRGRPPASDPGAGAGAGAGAPRSQAPDPGAPCLGDPGPGAPRSEDPGPDAPHSQDPGPDPPHSQDPGRSGTVSEDHTLPE